MSKLLSICIPTYQREDLFELCIKSLETNIIAMDENIELEILVSINDSSNYKLDVLSKYKSLKQHLVIIQNSENIGGDKNIINCYKKASGKYIWVVGDDDYILEDSIAYLIKEIRDKELSCIFLNSYGYKKSYDEKPIFNELTYAYDFNHFIEKVSYRSTFISSIIVNRELVDFSDAVHSENTSLYQLNLLLQASSHNNNLYIGKFMIAAKINYEYNYDFYEIFVNNYSQQLLSYLDSDIYKKVLIKTILLFYSQYFLYRRLNHISIDNLIEFDSSLSRYLSYRIIRPIVILPRWAALIYGVSVIALSRIRYGDIFLLISKLLLKIRVSSMDKSKNAK